MIATAPRQTRFTMPIADNVRLVAMATVRAVTDDTAEEATERAEDHKAANYLPAFDLSRKGSVGDRREIFFWAGALRQTPSSITNPDAIIADCLLTNLAGLINNQEFYLRTHQLEVAWCISNQTLINFIKDQSIIGVRVGRNWKVNRSSAATFLKSRML